MILIKLNETITNITFVEVYEMELLVNFDIRKPRMRGFSFCKERKVMNEASLLRADKLKKWLICLGVK